MQSSSGAYLSNLDHLRAFAVLQVFVWHFVHTSSSCPTPCFDRDFATIGPLVLFEEGHSGVALFMCISGYVFAHLTHGKRIDTALFWMNRALRLLPLLVFWSVVTALLNPGNKPLDPMDMARGIIAPGGWSIVIELQFYLLFPLLLIVSNRYGNRWLMGVVLLALILRAACWLEEGTVQNIAYWTLGGRIDQFLVGYCAYGVTANRRAILAFGAIAVAVLVVAYSAFSYAGGFYGIGGYPSRDPLWIYWPLLEAVCYCAMIRAYILLEIPRRLDGALAHVGAWSYSIYLSHFYLVPILFPLLENNLGMPGHFTGRFLFAIAAFPVVVGVSAATYNAIERPFLGFRRRYVHA
jgi:peptidoglycan/LPS O-acetylase OafA/YrhL